MDGIPEWESCGQAYGDEAYCGWYDTAGLKGWWFVAWETAELFAKELYARAMASGVGDGVVALVAMEGVGMALEP